MCYSDERWGAELIDEKLSIIARIVRDGCISQF